MSPAPVQPPLRLAIVNDYEVVVRGLAAMLEPHADRITVTEHDADRVAHPVDIALFDAFSMVCCQDDDSLDELVADPNVGRLVVYTWALPPQVLDSLPGRGVSGALPKSMGADELVAALEQIHAGEVVLAPELAGDDVAAGAWPGQEHGLTARESEVIALITDGLSNNDIAARTYLSINSVKSYIRSAYRTMGVSSRSQAVLWGIDHGFARTRHRVLRGES